MSAEDEVDVALFVHDKRGPTVVVEGSGVHLIRGEAQGVDASPHGPGPGAGRVGVSGHVRILMRSLVGDIGHAVEMLGGRVLHVADGLSVAIVAEVVAWVSRPDATRTAQAERYQDPEHWEKGG